MTEKARRNLILASTFATFINALGLALGLWLIDKNPNLAVTLVVASIVLYAFLRLAVGYIEAVWGVVDVDVPVTKGSNGGPISRPLTAYKVEVTFKEKED